MLLSALSSFAVSFLCGVVKDMFSAWQARRIAVAQGRAEAVAEGQAASLETIAVAGRVEAEAAATQAADSSDAAFDQEFRRRS